VTVNGERDILGSGDPRDRAAMSWEYGAGDGDEGAKFWLAVFSPRSTTGGLKTSASWSATGSRGCPTR